MKQIAFLLFASILILIGCGSKDKNTDASIVGNWTVNHYIEQYYLNDSPAGGDTTTSGNFKFESNNNFSASDLNGNNISGTYNYNSSSKDLNLVSDGDTLYFKVTNLTVSNLHIHEELTDNAAGYTSKYVADGDFKR